MGRLYLKTVSGETTLAIFDSGQLRVPCLAGTAVRYDCNGRIYDGGSKQAIATCDTDGNIHKGAGSGGTVLARCIDGKIYKGSAFKTVLAHYDGDMFGAAAAAMAVLSKIKVAQIKFLAE